jgi:hypothetical protein
MGIKDQILEYLKRERPLRVTNKQLSEDVLGGKYSTKSVRKATLQLAERGILEKSHRYGYGRHAFYWVSYIHEPLAGLRPKSSACLYN